MRAGSIETLWVFLVLCPIGIDGPKSLGMYVVHALKRESNEAFCMGGIVSSRTIITACSCIGTFLFEEDNNYYIFKEFDTRNELIKTFTNQVYEIERPIINRHCTPSKWDTKRFHFNLGGWKIEGSFELNIYGILQPIDKESHLSFDVIIDGKVTECYAVGFDKAEKKMRGSLVTIQKDQLSCLGTYCTVLSRGKEIDCEKIQYSVLNGPNKCAFLAKKVQVDFMEGTPVYCNINSEYYIFGVGMEKASTVLFFTRTDVHPNYEFYRSVYLGINLASTVGFSSSVLFFSALKPAMTFL